MKRKLKPCPFCGANSKYFERLMNCPDSPQDGASIICTGCETKGPTAYGDEETVSIILEEADNLWNARP